MGKSPGKWIKTLLLGKKSSKSNLSKGRENSKSANKGEPLVSTRVPVSESTVDPPLIFPPAHRIGASNEVDSEQRVAATSPNDGVSLLSAKDDNAQTIINLGSQEDAERLRHHKAATKAQAALRGYLARRAFRTLKGIIRLQALIRGYLVRRQAVATLCCVRGIIKLQALARGQKVRCSDIGIEVQKICNQGKLPGANCSDSPGTNTSTWAEKLSNNAFIRKLLASSPTAIPLCLQYGPGEPNSAREWLERWTRSRFWEQPQSQDSQPKKNIDSKSQTKRGSFQTRETEQGRPKRSVRKPSSATVENGLSRSASESEKPKRNPRKVPCHPVDSVHEHPQNETEKVKHSLRKVSDSTKEVSDRLEVDNQKPKRSMKKASISAAADASEQSTGNSVEKMKDVTVVVSKQSDADPSLKLLPADDSVEELHDHPAHNLQPVENNGNDEGTQGINKEFNSKDHPISNENQKTSQRRASLPGKIDQQENGVQTTPKVPSYMAPTESAKARLRGQGSPRFAQDAVEYHTRRHSLPSSINGKLTSLSPRVPRLVQAAGKGVIRTDKSLSSSRDGGDKAEWRR